MTQIITLIFGVTRLFRLMKAGYSIHHAEMAGAATGMKLPSISANIPIQVSGYKTNSLYCSIHYLIFIISSCILIMAITIAEYSEICRYSEQFFKLFAIKIFKITIIATDSFCRYLRRRDIFHSVNGFTYQILLLLNTLQ